MESICRVRLYMKKVIKNKTHYPVTARLSRVHLVIKKLISIKSTNNTQYKFKSSSSKWKWLPKWASNSKNSNKTGEKDFRQEKNSPNTWLQNRLSRANPSKRKNQHMITILPNSKRLTILTNILPNLQLALNPTWTNINYIPSPHPK